MSLTAFERETVVNFNDGENIAEVYTAQRPVITKLKKNPAAKLIEEGTFEGSVWARFELPKALVSFRSGRVKRQLTQEQRRDASERMKRARSLRVAA